MEGYIAYQKYSSLDFGCLCDSCILSSEYVFVLVNWKQVKRPMFEQARKIIY